ncbi:MAG TPA: cytochrome P450 [Acidimicrobiia bacterium]
MTSVPGYLDADPAVRMAALAELRAQCPVAPPLAEGRPWTAVSHEAVETVFREIYTFGGSAGSTGLDEDDTSIAGILEPRHGQIRRIINAVVAFHRSQQIEPFLVQLSERLVGEFAAAASVAGPDGTDVMPLAVDPVPPNAMARLLGFPAADAARYYAWADQIGAAFAAAAAEGRSISMAEAVPEFTQYVDDRIAQRLATPEADWPQDALTRFLSTDIEGVRLSPRAIRVQILFMIGAGSETTRNLMGSALYRLARDPELYAHVRAERSQVEAVIEETLRIDAPAQFLVRRCLADTALTGQPLHEGEHVMISLSSANWDDSVFPAPDMFDLDRDTVRQHVAFGSGPHICPGAPLARLEARSLLNAFVDRFDRIGLGAGYEFDHLAHGMLHGPHTLRLVVHEAADQ